MFATTPARTIDTQTAIDTASFLAVVVTADRPGVLRALTRQAVEHFHHDHLFVQNIHVVPSGAGSAFLATADFSALAPQV